MSLLKILDKIQQNKLQPFLAPLPVSTVSCFTFQNRIPYWFELKESQTGWWIIEPLSSHEAKLAREALPHEYLSYLSQLPRYIVIAIEPIREGIVVVPYNASDATQRGWLNSKPKVVYLPRNLEILPFSTLIVRSMAGVLLFDDYYPLDVAEQEKLLAKPKGNFQVAWQILQVRKEEQLRLEKERQRLEFLKTERGQIEDRLNFVGATLIDYQKQGSKYDVTYTYNGAQFTVNLRPDLRVDSAGICLSDEDSNYDLSSICLVMEEARKLNRPGIREEYYL